MVEVQMADQHDVDVMAHRRVGQLAEAPQRPDPALERRVGEDPQAVHLDQDGALTDVRHASLPGGLRRPRLVCRPRVSHGGGPASLAGLPGRRSSTSLVALRRRPDRTSVGRKPSLA